MQFVKPMLFQEAIDKLGERSLIGAQISSSEWRDVPLALRERAFFSSTIESMRFLQRSRDWFTDYLSNARETLENGQTVLKAGSRAQFVRDLSAYAISEGMGDLAVGHKGEGGKGGLRDITSEKRLGLIFDVQTRQAQDYGFWKQGMDPDVLNEFPAQRFIREVPVKEPRQAHAQYEGEVRLKSDLQFWIAINQDFGVPWGPWGWGCGHGVEDVDRDEAEKLGLIAPGEQPAAVEKDFNDGLEASVRGLDDDLVAKLQEDFGEQIDVQGDTAVWREQLRPEVLPHGAPAREDARPAAPTTNRPRLEEVLDQTGLSGNAIATADKVTGFLSELQEERPVLFDGVVRSVTVPRYANFGAAEVRAAAQEFLNYLPPELVDRLPKLDLRIESLSGANGLYGNGGIVRLNSKLGPKEMRRVLFHELAHWVHREGPAEFRAAIRAHFEERTAGEAIKRLAPYGRGVRGKRDLWYDAYAGRIYGWETSDLGLEVPTRYAEWLTMEPEKMAAYWNDPKFRETMMIVLQAFF